MHHSKPMKQKIPSPIGYTILFIALAGSATVPNLSLINPDVVIGIANASRPKGLPSTAFGKLSDEPIFKAVIQNGGQVLLVSQITNVEIKNPAGVWDPNEGAIKLKVGDYQYDDFLNTLKHEAIHMAQSCKSNSLKAEPQLLGLGITAEGLNDLEPYREKNTAYYLSEIEREAHSHDSNDQATIVQVLNDHCVAKPWIILTGKLRASLQMWFLPRRLKDAECCQQKNESALWCLADLPTITNPQ